MIQRKCQDIFILKNAGSYQISGRCISIYTLSILSFQDANQPNYYAGIQNVTPNQIV